MSDTNGTVTVPTVEAAVVNALQMECGETARDHGFTNDWHMADWLEERANDLANGVTLDSEDAVTLREIAAMLRTNILGTKLMLIVSELSEGLESLRHNDGARGALEGKGNFGEELADAIVRILDTGTFTKNNLGDELLKKMAVNRDRPYMHGNKAM